eukprot:ANDGO_04941.mRNA.1 hypothetical protein
MDRTRKAAAASTVVIELPLASPSQRPSSVRSPSKPLRLHSSHCSSRNGKSHRAVSTSPPVSSDVFTVRNRRVESSDEYDDDSSDSRSGSDNDNDRHDRAPLHSGKPAAYSLLNSAASQHQNTGQLQSYSRPDIAPVYPQSSKSVHVAKLDLSTLAGNNSAQLMTSARQNSFRGKGTIPKGAFVNYASAREKSKKPAAAGSKGKRHAVMNDERPDERVVHSSRRRSNVASFLFTDRGEQNPHGTRNRTSSSTPVSHRGFPQRSLAASVAMMYDSQSARGGAESEYQLQQAQLHQRLQSLQLQQQQQSSDGTLDDQGDLQQQGSWGDSEVKTLEFNMPAYPARPSIRLLSSYLGQFDVADEYRLRVLSPRKKVDPMITEDAQTPMFVCNSPPQSPKGGRTSAVSYMSISRPASSSVRKVASSNSALALQPNLPKSIRNTDDTSGRKTSNGSISGSATRPGSNLSMAPWESTRPPTPLVSDSDRVAATASAALHRRRNRRRKGSKTDLSIAEHAEKDTEGPSSTPRSALVDGEKYLKPPPSVRPIMFSNPFQERMYIQALRDSFKTMYEEGANFIDVDQLSKNLQQVDDKFAGSNKTQLDSPRSPLNDLRVQGFRPRPFAGRIASNDLETSSETSQSPLGKTGRTPLLFGDRQLDESYKHFSPSVEDVVSLDPRPILSLGRSVRRSVDSSAPTAVEVSAPAQSEIKRSIHALTLATMEDADKLARMRKEQQILQIRVPSSSRPTSATSSKVGASVASEIEFVESMMKMRDGTSLHVVRDRYDQILDQANVGSVRGSRPSSAARASSVSVASIRSDTAADAGDPVRQLSSHVFDMTLNAKEIEDRLVQNVAKMFVEDRLLTERIREHAIMDSQRVPHPPGTARRPQSGDASRGSVRRPQYRNAERPFSANIVAPSTDKCLICEKPKFQAKIA